MDCESRPAEQWKAMKNLFPWITAYHLTRHGCTDPSHSFRMTTDAFLIMTPYRPRSFWTGTRIPYEKGREAGQWHRVKNLLLWWRLAVFLTTVIDPSHSFRMTTDAFLTTTADSSHSFRMTAYHFPRHECTDPSRSFRPTINISLIMTPFPPIVILNEDKNAVWERRETE